MGVNSKTSTISTGQIVNLVSNDTFRFEIVSKFTFFIIFYLHIFTIMLPIGSVNNFCQTSWCIHTILFPDLKHLDTIWTIKLGFFVCFHLFFCTLFIYNAFTFFSFRLPYSFTICGWHQYNLSYSPCCCIESLAHPHLLVLVFCYCWPQYNLHLEMLLSDLGWCII